MTLVATTSPTPEVSAVLRLHRKYHGVPIPRGYIRMLRTGARRSQLSKEVKLGGNLQ